MRLWHQGLLNKLPRQQLLGQHRECCALRGKGWARKHSTVDYVFEYNLEKLVAYHFQVMWEMKERGYKIDESWWHGGYRGKTLGVTHDFNYFELGSYISQNDIIYNEHNDDYLQECLENLNRKGVKIAP